MSLTEDWRTWDSKQKAEWVAAEVMKWTLGEDRSGQLIFVEPAIWCWTFRPSESLIQVETVAVKMLGRGYRFDIIWTKDKVNVLVGRMKDIMRGPVFVVEACAESKELADAICLAASLACEKEKNAQVS